MGSAQAREGCVAEESDRKNLVSRVGLEHTVLPCKLIVPLSGWLQVVVCSDHTLVRESPAPNGSCIICVIFYLFYVYSSYMF